MKKLLYMIAMALCVANLFCSCDKDEVEMADEGRLGSSYWTSEPASDSCQFYTLQFSGASSCRFREYVTDWLDIDHKEHYELRSLADGVYAITDYRRDLAAFNFIDQNTIELIYQGQVIVLHRR